MKMHKKILSRIPAMTWVLAFSWLCLACEKEDPRATGRSVGGGETKVFDLNTAKVVDMMLLYHGGIQRPDWTEAEVTPYLTYTDPETKKKSWAFDGFLFIEFEDGKGRNYVAPIKEGNTDKPARKEEWEFLLNRNFETGKGIDALDKAIAKLVPEMGAPKRKRKVILTLPEPWPDQQDWGYLNSEQMNFSKQSDRLKALRWYIDQAIAKWNARNPQYLELAGFYWVPETAYISQAMLPSVKAYISGKGNFYFYWIPHWNSFGPSRWEKLGFDITYQQPNAYFHKERIVSVPEVVNFARNEGLSLEFEFDEAILARNNNADKRTRFLEYFNSFNTPEGVFSKYPLAYYQSHFAWAELMKSTDPADIELATMLGRKIVERQEKADELVK
ncbi:MAG: DUF4855 domain-containing protein [Adhaeribacter sp.]